MPLIEKKLNYCKLSGEVTIGEIKKEITRLTILETLAGNADGNLKVIINSIYGVLGFHKFIAYFRPSAMTITKQSKKVILLTEEAVNDYVVNIWKTDYKAHKLMGLTNTVDISHEITDYVVYIDTDSVFININDIYRYANTDMDMVDFGLKFYNDVLVHHINKVLEEFCVVNGAYTKKFTGDISYKLDLEQISESITWTAAKHYIKHQAWEKGIRYPRLSKITTKGIEVSQSAFPKFIRDNMKVIINYIVDKGRTMTRYDVAEKIKPIKDEFETIEIEEICIGQRISKYEKYIATDTEEITVNPNCGIALKAAAYHNHLLYHNPELKKKYSIIKNRDKVKYYYIQDAGKIETFGYIEGSFPIEVAPPIDYDMQFEKVFLTPMNSIIKAMGFEALSVDLIVLNDDFFG